jgi:hypothetical protein
MKKSLHVQLSLRKTDGMVALWFVVLLLIVAWAFMTGGSDPRYHGRALSMWQVDLDANKAGVRERAKIVLTEAARKAAPRFIQTLRGKDSDLKLFMIGLAYGFRTTDERREKAVAEFSRFSVGAIPVLTNLLDDPALAVRATRTLSGTGLAGAAPLVRALNHTNASVRMYAAFGLSSLYLNCVQFKSLVHAPGSSGNFPTNGAVAALVKLLKDESPDARASAAMALGDMREQPESVIPALTECLAETTDSQVRQAVAEALGRYGRRAIAAVSSLKQLMDDSDPAVRNAARRALKKIDAREQNDRSEMNN